MKKSLEMFPAMGHWLSCKDGDGRAFWLYLRHYSCYQYKDNRRIIDRRFVGPCRDRLVLLGQDCLSLFVWKEWNDPSGQTGLYNSIFHNEGARLSSELILEAEQLAVSHWPLAERFYTYVDDEQVSSANPGYCFKQAGWQLVRGEDNKPTRTGSGKLILEKYPK